MPSELQKLYTKYNAIKRLFAQILLQYQRMNKSKSRRVLLYEQARLSIGRDVSPLDIANDDLGCAESVSQLIRKVVKFPIITGTWTLNAHLAADPRFIKATEFSGPGTIIICATGTGNGKMRGHVGIFGTNQKIMAASSDTGKWRKSYTWAQWHWRFALNGGFTIHYYQFK